MSEEALEAGAAPASAKGLAVLVVGMHRSGTSALSGVLNLLGVAAPADLIPADEHNQRGYFEPQKIIDFHESLFSQLGSPSNDPLPLSYAWVDSPIGAAAADTLAQLIDEEMGGAPMCLFKDPRICRLMPVWTAALEKSGHAGVAVLPCRHPLEVAGSLTAKAGLSRPYGLSMWLQHVVLGERFTRGMRRSFVSYEGLLGDWRGVVSKAAQDLELVWPRDLMRAGVDVDAFLTGELRRQRPPERPLAADGLERLCARAWAVLPALQNDPNDAAACAELDAVAAEMDAVVEVAGPLIVSFQGELSGARQQLDQTLRGVGDLLATEQNLRTTEQDLRAKVASGAAERSSLRTYVFQLQREGAAARDAVGMRDDEIRARNDAIWQRDVVIQHRDREIVARNEALHALLGERDQLIQERDRAGGERDAAIEQRYAEVVERDTRIRQLDAELAAATAYAHAAAARAAAIESSTSWRLMRALTAPLARAPGLRRAIRGGLKLTLWTLTFQLPRRLRERGAALQGAQANEAAAPAAATEAASWPHAAPVVEAPPPPAPPRIDYQRLLAPETWPEAAPWPAPQPVARPDHKVAPRVVFISGEPSTPGHAYRVLRYADAARRAGALVNVINIENAANAQAEIERGDLVVIWRAPWDENVAVVVEITQRTGSPILFDIDDLLVEPELAKSDVIDGIRSQEFDEAEVREHFERFQRTFLAADYCSAPTELLAQRLRRHGHPAFVLPNGFDEDGYRRSRAAARARRATPHDGLIRIGYASGSKTHQKDFAQAAEGVARVMREHPETRLVLFRSKWGDVVDIAEFSAFNGLRDRIEWRDLVPIEQLPDELARFDVNLAPLEVDNIFCEAKSELKFYEAALVDVPTVASPTQPYRAAIRHGETGYLAVTPEDWYAAVKALVSGPALRARMARAAQFDAIADYGPARRVEQFVSVMEQVLSRGRHAARAFELEIDRDGRPRPKLPHVPEHEIVFESDGLTAAEVTVMVPLYNYAGFVVEALESAKAQTLFPMDIVVVDDGSTDDSLEVARAWLQANASRFGRAVLIRNAQNSGLAFTRNVGFANADTPFVLPLDADNRLLPDCADRLRQAAERSAAAFAYPLIRQFGDADQVHGQPYDPARLVIANYIDAMALVRRSAWAAVGGYDHVRYGWEDYDLWCRFAEDGLFGEHVPEPLAEYRVHQSSMLRSETDETGNKLALIKDIEARHPWLRIGRDLPGATPLPDEAPEA